MAKVTTKPSLPLGRQGQNQHRSERKNHREYPGIHRDEGEAYAAKLSKAGVAVNQTRFDGQIHAFFTMLLVFEAAGKAVDLAAIDLKAAFGTS